VLPRLECPYAKLDPVSADIDAAMWRGIAPIFLKENIAGGEPLQATWFKAAWDERELRVLFHSVDSYAWATHTAHDAPLYDEEVVEIFLDPVGDLESYFEIEVNPLNAVCDLVLRRSLSGYKKDFGWHCDGMQTFVKTGADFWTVEMSIPFASLGSAASPAAGNIWRANFHRIDRPRDSEWELSAWSPTGQKRFHIQEKFGHLEFVR